MMNALIEDLSFRNRNLEIGSPMWCTQDLLVKILTRIDQDNINTDLSSAGLVITIRDIKPMLEEGSDFSVYGIQCLLRGIAERFKNEDGSYNIDLKTTHDLNSCRINLTELLFVLRCCK